MVLPLLAVAVVVAAVTGKYQVMVRVEEVEEAV